MGRTASTVVVHRVNVDHRIRESVYDNNASSLLLALRRGPACKGAARRAPRS